MSVEYNVVANLILQGDGSASARLDAVGARADRVSHAMTGIGQRAAAGMAMLGSAVGGAIDRMASLAVATAKWSAIAAAGGAIMATKVGLFDVNAQLEKTELGFATLFTMFGSAPDFAGGLQMGRELLEGIRQDAAALPGEFQDFASMAQTMTAPLTQLGEGIDGIRRVTRETVVTAAALGVNYDQAAREMAMLLEGHAGAHNILGMRLGIRADTRVEGKEWHEAGSADRLKYVEQLMGKTAPALDAYTRSWAGMSSTLVDSMKRFLGEATQPLFERMKGGLTKLLAYTDTHKDQIRQLESLISNRLIAAYDFLEAKVAALPSYVAWLEDHWEVIRGQVAGVGVTLESAFERAWPIVRKVGEFLGHELENPARALKELLAIRVGAAALQAAPGVLNAAGGAAKLFGAGEGAAVAGGAAIAGTEAGTAVAGGAAAGVGGALAAVAAPLIAIGVAIFDDFAGSAASAKAMVTDMWDGITAALKPLFEQGSLVRDMLDVLGAVVIVNLRIFLAPIELMLKGVQIALELLNAGWTWLKDSMTSLYDSSSTVKTIVDGVTDAFKWLVDVLKSVWERVRTFSIFEDSDLKPDEEVIDRSTTAAPWLQASAEPMKGEQKPKQTEKSPVFYAPGAKFEIKLDVRNDNPDRIVRRVFDEIGKVATRPITSAWAPPSKAF